MREKSPPAVYRFLFMGHGSFFLDSKVIFPYSPSLKRGFRAHALPLTQTIGLPERRVVLIKGLSGQAG